MAQGFKFQPDFMCLQELKLSRRALNSNLQRIGSKWTWFATQHSTGKGGATIAIDSKYKDFVTQVHVSQTNSWIAISVKAPFRFTLVSIYASNSMFERAASWSELLSLSQPCIFTGDFNMVENIDDRWNRKGQSLGGKEKESFTALVDKHHLVDISHQTGFTWTNNQQGTYYRAARLDRLYMNFDLLQEFWHVNCWKDSSLQLSDHSPIIFELQKEVFNFKAGWFHIDQSLLKINCVKERVKEIFDGAFEENTSAFKAWDLVVKNTQEP
ncbi:hypothetical protein L7F22_003671 [Adiantum nelumboides]|nr:hypothetical protein [Adiantum nelumboides]